MQYSVHEAKTHLSRLLAQVAAGEEVTITSGKEKMPVAKIVPFPEKKKVRLGWGDDWPELDMEHPFWDPLPDDELALWNGQGD